MDNNTRNGIIFVLVSSFGIALFPIFTKYIYQLTDFTPFDLVFWRFGLSVPFMWLATSAWIQITRPPKLEKPLPRIQLMLTSVFVVAAGLAGFFGLRFVDAGLYVVLFYTYPVMTVVINTFLGEPLHLRGWVALFMTMMGAVLMVINPMTILTGAAEMMVTPLGVIIGLLNALVIALFVIINERIQRGYPMTARSSAWTFTGTLFIIIPMGAVQGVKIPPTGTVWLILLGMSLLATVIAYFGLIMGNKLLGPSRTSIIGTSEPVLAVILAWLLLDEALSGLQIVGMVLIISSIIVLESGSIGRKRPTDVVQAAGAD